MGRFHKERLCVFRISIYVILVIMLTEINHSMAEKPTDKQETNLLNRRRRQAADIILMDFKAQKALKGTTKPSDYFRRIGKKWNGPPSHGNSEIVLRPDDYGGGLYVDDEYVENW